MSSLILATLAFLCPLAGAAIGLTVRGRLPAHHLSRDSVDVIKLATGLMATLVALVLSLLISSANTVRVQFDSEYRQALAGIDQLDQSLRAYGPEATDARQLLRRIVVRGAQQWWPEEDFGTKDSVGVSVRDAMVDLERRLLRLHSANDEQKYFREQALQLLRSLVQLQTLVSNQAGSSSLPLPVLIVVVLSSAVIFGNFGLFVTPNATLMAALALAALATAGAVFLIVELNAPLTGLLKLSSAPVRALLATLSS